MLDFCLLKTQPSLCVPFDKHAHKNFASTPILFFLCNTRWLFVSYFESNHTSIG